MPLHKLSNDVWLCITSYCDGMTSNSIAATCKQFRQVFRRNRQFVLVATPARIQSGMFKWLKRYMVANTGTEVDGPPVGYLTIVLPQMPDYDDDDSADHLPVCDDDSDDNDDSDPEKKPRPYAHESEFLSVVRLAVVSIPNIKLVVGHHSPMSSSQLAFAMQSLARGGCLVLDLSDLVDCDLTAFHMGRSMWAPLLRLGRLHLKLENTNADDRLVRGMVCAIEASLIIGKRPVAWRDLTLELAQNLITDEGLTQMIRGLGRCPRLVQLTLDVTDNKRIQHSDKVATIMDAVGHIPSLHIKLNASIDTRKPTIQRSHPRHPCLFLSFVFCLLKGTKRGTICICPIFESSAFLWRDTPFSSMHCRFHIKL